jgi:hypothetical protein
MEPVGDAEPEGDGWRTRWRVANADPRPVHVLGATAPHAKFRGEASLDLDVPGNGSATFPLVVRINGSAGGEIENAFVILLLEDGAAQWRVLARLRVPLDDSARPEPRVEAITVQRVGFSGEL